ILPADLSEAKVELWTKRAVFEQAQGYPRPLKHHHHCRGCNEGRNVWESRQQWSWKMIDSVLKTTPDELLADETLGHADAVASSRRDYPNIRRDNADQPNFVHLQQVMACKQYQVADEAVELAMKRHCLRVSLLFSEFHQDRVSMAERSPTTSFEWLSDLPSQELSEDEWTLI
ncbi:MAG: hypothetical protein M1830_006382, partial [Pleopsidium flavum]